VTLEAAKIKFLSLARRGRSMEKAWDKAVIQGDIAKQIELDELADTFQRSWEKYEAMGLRVHLVGKNKWAVTTLDAPAQTATCPGQPS
jgi:hypothetical protein